MATRCGKLLKTLQDYLLEVEKVWQRIWFSHFNEMKFRKKVLRQAQRSYEAKINTSRREHTMEALSNNQNVFFRLIKSQCNQKVKSTSKIDYMNKTWEGDEVIEGWAQYFEELAKTKGYHPNFDNNHMLAKDLKWYWMNNWNINIQQKSTQHIQLYKSNSIKVIKNTEKTRKHLINVTFQQSILKMYKMVSHNP